MSIKNKTKHELRYYNNSMLAKRYKIADIIVDK